MGLWGYGTPSSHTLQLQSLLSVFAHISPARSVACAATRTDRRLCWRQGKFCRNDRLRSVSQMCSYCACVPYIVGMGAVFRKHKSPGMTIWSSIIAQMRIPPMVNPTVCPSGNNPRRMRSSQRCPRAPSKSDGTLAPPTTITLSSATNHHHHRRYPAFVPWEPRFAGVGHNRPAPAKRAGGELVCDQKCFCKTSLPSSKTVSQ